MGFHAEDQHPERRPDERLTTRVSVYLNLIHEGKILLIRRHNTGWGDGSYTMVSGHVEKNEKIGDAMVREAGEEIGIVLRSEDLAVNHVMKRKSNAPYIDFFLTATKWEGEPTLTETDKSDDMQWFPIDNLPETTLPYVRQALDFIQNNVFFSELDP